MASSSQQPTKIMAFPAFSRKSNPYNSLLYHAVQAKGAEVIEFSFKKAFLTKADIVHVHWPEFFLNSHYFLKALLFSVLLLVALAVQKMKGAKLVWTLHNLKPHQIKYPLLSAVFWWIYKRMVNGVLSLSQANHQIAVKAMPEIQALPFKITYHGLFQCETRALNKISSRQLLKLPEDKYIVLCLGQIKAYKGYEHLVELARQAQERGLLLHVIIAGKTDDQSYVEQLRHQAQACPFEIRAGFVSDADLPHYYKAADVSVIPFNAIFNSGSALMSVSQETPVLIPFTDNFQEYAKALYGGLITYETLTPELVVNTIKANTFHLSQVSSELQWRHIAQETIALYKELIGNAKID